jgi:hypothetical protein
LTLVTNESEDSEAVIARRILPGDEPDTERSLEVAWPQGVYSLSHVALPFPPEDPLYGTDPTGISPLHLGNLALYGERGLLAVPDSDLVRLRWNPFHAYMVERTLEFLSLRPDPEAEPS